MSCFVEHRGALSHHPIPNSNLAMALRLLRFVPSGTCMRYLIAGSVSLLVHLAAFSLLASTIAIDGAFDLGVHRVAGAELIVYLASPTKSASSAKPPIETRSADSRAPSSSAADSTHHSALTIFSSYLSIKELDVAPAIVRDIDVASEEIKSRPSPGGTLMLRLWIDESGHVVRAEPPSSEMPAIYAETAARAFMRAKFSPGIKNGNAVKSRINVVLVYPAVQRDNSPANSVSSGAIEPEK